MESDAHGGDGVEDFVHGARVGPEAIGPVAVDAEVIELDALGFKPGDHRDAGVHVGTVVEEFDAVGDAEFDVGIFGVNLFVDFRDGAEQASFVGELPVFDRVVVTVEEVHGVLREGGDLGFFVVFHPQRRQAGEEVVFDGHVILRAVIDVFVEIGVVMLPLGRFEVEPLAGERNHGGVEERGGELELFGRDDGGFFIIVGVDLVELEKAEGDAEVEGMTELVEGNGKVLNGMAGGVGDLDGDVGLAVFFDVGVDGVGHEFLHGVPFVGIERAGGDGLGDGAGFEGVSGEMGIGIGDFQWANFIRGGGGEEDVGGVVFLGEGEQGIGVESVDGLAAGEEAGVVGGECDAGFEVGEAREPGGGEVGGEVELGAVAPIADEGAFSEDAEGGEAGGGEEKGVLGSVVVGPLGDGGEGGVGGDIALLLDEDGGGEQAGEEEEGERSDAHEGSAGDGEENGENDGGGER